VRTAPLHAVARLRTRRRRIELEREQLLDVEFLVEREREPDRRVEHRHGPMHQFLEQVRLRAQRVQRAADVIERLELKELAPELEVRLRQLTLPLGPAAFTEQEIALPIVIERTIGLVDSDQERLGLRVATRLHERSAQEIHRFDRRRLFGLGIDDGPESLLGLGELPLLVRAERSRVAVRGATGRRRRGHCRERQ